jgi:hypothetical protein
LHLASEIREAIEKLPGFFKATVRVAETDFSGKSPYRFIYLGEKKVSEKIISNGGLRADRIRGDNTKELREVIAKFEMQRSSGIVSLGEIIKSIDPQATAMMEEKGTCLAIDRAAVPTFFAGLDFRLDGMKFLLALPAEERHEFFWNMPDGFTVREKWINSEAHRMSGGWSTYSLFIDIIASMPKETRGTAFSRLVEEHPLPSDHWKATERRLFYDNIWHALTDPEQINVTDFGENMVVEIKWGSDDTRTYIAKPTGLQYLLSHLSR